LRCARKEVHVVPRVLVVDDDPSVRELLVRGLEDAGHETQTAGGGREALRKLCRATAEDEPFDAMVLDIIMPEISGWDVLEAVRANPLWREMPVVVISGFANKPEDMARVLDYDGFFVEKSGNWLEVLNSALGRLVDAA